MVTLNSAQPGAVGAGTPDVVPLHETHALLLEVTDAVGTIRDTAHLQYCLYLGQEFRVIGGRRFWFAPDDSSGGLPYSLILADHVRQLLSWGLLQNDEVGGPCREPLMVTRRDRARVDRSQVVIAPQIDVLATLGADETAALAGAVFHLSHHGRHPGHPKFSSDLRPAVRTALGKGTKVITDESRVDRIYSTGLQLRAAEPPTIVSARAS